MVLADRGVVCIDEFDKMNDIDRVAIHEVTHSSVPCCMALSSPVAFQAQMPPVPDRCAHCAIPNMNARQNIHDVAPECFDLLRRIAATSSS